MPSASANWAGSTRCGGRKGGLRLAPQSSGLTIGEIVRETETDFALVGCFPHHENRSGGTPCVIEPACQLKGVFARARDAFLRELDGHTLEQVAGPAGALSSLLGMIPVKVVHASPEYAEALG